MPIPFQITGEMISGIPGEIAFDGPTRALAAILDSGDAANNVFSRAFTYADNTVETVQAGGTGVFAGLLIHPKAYAIDAATMANGAQAELLFMGEVYAEVEGAADAVIGDPVYYVTETGALTMDAEGGTAVPNAVISRHNVSPETPTLAVIKLTN